MSNMPFSRHQWRTDLVSALPALGMIVGAALGAALGLLNPDASAVLFGGIGIAVGLVLGLFLRVVFRA
jgi:nucleoside phosphorylase